MDPEVVFLAAIPVFSLSMLAEALLVRGRSDVKGYTWKDSLGSISMGLGFMVIDVFWRLLVVVPLYTFLSGHPIINVWAALPGPLAYLCLLFADDFTFYWFHRAGHVVRLFWAAHHTHHSSEHYNLSTALRQSWGEMFYQPLFWGPIALLGVPVEMILLQHAISLLYQFGLHTELGGRSGPLGLVFNTASHHRVHHGRSPQHLDRNYAGIFIIWDRLFGTFTAEDGPVDYGTVRPMRSYNPLIIAFEEPLTLARDAVAAGGLLPALKVIFGPPGAKPFAQAEAGK